MKNNFSRVCHDFKEALPLVEKSLTVDEEELDALKRVDSKLDCAVERLEQSLPAQRNALKRLISGDSLRPSELRELLRTVKKVQKVRMALGCLSAYVKLEHNLSGAECSKTLLLAQELESESAISFIEHLLSRFKHRGSTLFDDELEQFLPLSESMSTEVQSF